MSQGNITGRKTGITDGANSTSTPLNSLADFTGTSSDCSAYPSVMVSCKTDQNGKVYIEFSVDGTNWDSSIERNVYANTNKPMRFSVSKRYVRVRFINTSASNQTYLRLQTIFGEQVQLNSPLNSLIAQDADAIVTRSISEEIFLASGLYDGFSIVNKFGNNPDIDMAGNEDIWGGDGLYTGFPTGSAETVAVFSSSVNDASAGTGLRTVRLTGLDANYNVQSETVTLNGVTPVNTINTFIRLHTATAQTVGSGGVNAGTITFRHTTTTTNVFLSMSIGRNQTNCSAYTVPSGYTVYMRELHISCGTASPVALEGNIWTRPFGGVFRSRRPFYLSNTSNVRDRIYGGLVFTEKADIVLRINTCTANNTPVNGGYDLILVRN